ncbi:MAG: thiol-disulfide oxidoreductase DCC family protein [Rhodothermales bacterium]|nr:thiol-disulfide oxidoreductase DCC family protein [Rhodothermales bacterium]
MTDKRQLSRGIVLFDGVCNLCNGSVNFAIDRLPLTANIRFGALQSEAGRSLVIRAGRDPEVLDSIIFITDNRIWRESTAVFKIVERMRMPWRMLYGLRIIPAFIRDPIYRWVARNRYGWFGKRDSCRIPTPELKSWFLSDLHDHDFRATLPGT